MTDSDLIQLIRQLIGKASILAQYMVFQINESSALDNIHKHTPVFLEQLKTLNCQSALEHFGSTLQPDVTLKKLPVDFVKIDASFTKNLGKNSNNQASIQQMVALSHKMNRKIIAEGIEDADSLSFLWGNLVDYAQGHYIQVPSKNLNYNIES